MNSLTVLTSFALIIALQLTTIPFASGDPAGALYFQSNEVDKNAIMVVTIEADGTLKDAKRVEIAGAKGAGPFAHIHSGDSVVVSDLFLFNTNYGSSQVTSHLITAADPTTITFADTKPSGGDLPNCLAVSSALKMVCVVNAGEKSGVFCLGIEADGKLTPHAGVLTPFSDPGSPINIPLPYAHGWGAPADAHFTLKNKFLTVSIKGNPKDDPEEKAFKPHTPGYILNFPVNAGAQVGTPVRNTFGIPCVPYSMNVLSDDPLIIGFTEPARGTYRIQQFTDDGKRHCGAQSGPIPLNRNICWNAVSAKSKNVYLVDALDLPKKNAWVHELSYTTTPLSVTLLPKNIGTKPALLDLTIVPLATADFLYIIHADPPIEGGGTAVNNEIFIVQINGPGDMKEMPAFKLDKVANSLVGMAHKLIKV